MLKFMLIVFLPLLCQASWVHPRVRYDDIGGSVSDLCKKGIALGAKLKEEQVSMFYTNKYGKSRTRIEIGRLYETNHRWMRITTDEIILERANRLMSLGERILTPQIMIKELLDKWDIATNNFEFPFCAQNLTSSSALCAAFAPNMTAYPNNDVVREIDSGQYVYSNPGGEQLEYWFNSTLTNRFACETLASVSAGWGMHLKMCNCSNINEFWNPISVQRCYTRISSEFSRMASYAVPQTISIDFPLKWNWVFEGSFHSMTNGAGKSYGFRRILESRYSIFSSSLIEQQWLFRAYEFSGGAGYCFTIFDKGDEHVYKLLLKYERSSPVSATDGRKWLSIKPERVWCRGRGQLSAWGRTPSGLLVMAERSTVFGNVRSDYITPFDGFNCISIAMPFATNFPSTFRHKENDSWRHLVGGSPKDFHWRVHAEMLRIPIPIHQHQSDQAR